MIRLVFVAQRSSDLYPDLSREGMDLNFGSMETGGC